LLCLADRSGWAKHSDNGNDAAVVALNVLTTAVTLPLAALIHPTARKIVPKLDTNLVSKQTKESP
jgi:hypothetical protein